MLESVINRYVNARERYLPMLVEWMKKGYIKLLHPHRQDWGETTESLSQYDEGTLGRVLQQFLLDGNINLEPKYESHDVYHVITGYGLGLNNEARMFFFLFGNGKRSVSILGSMLVAIVFIPDLIPTFYEDFKRGKDYFPLKKFDFNEMLSYDYNGIMAMLRRHKC
jgi:hypothetical protein